MHVASALLSNNHGSTVFANHGVKEFQRDSLIAI